MVLEEGRREPLSIDYILFLIWTLCRHAHFVIIYQQLTYDFYLFLDVCELRLKNHLKEKPEKITQKQNKNPVPGPHPQKF